MRQDPEKDSPLTSMSGTVCSWLWDTAFINEHGDVSACCEFAIGRIGNIYQEPLETIWTSSPRLQAARQQALAGKLGCFASCPHVSFQDKQTDLFFRSPVPNPLTPKLLHLTLSTRCPFHCVMCPQDHDSTVALDTDVLKRQIKWDAIDEVLLQGGELLAIPQAHDFYRWLTQEKLRWANVITNGVLLEESWMEDLLNGANWIEVSVNAASERMYTIVHGQNHFDRVIERIRQMTALKQKKACPPMIRFHFTIIPENLEEIPSAIRLAEDLGCDMVTYCYDQSVPALLNDEPEVRHDLRSRIQEQLGQTQIRIRGQFLEHLGLLEQSWAPERIVYCV